MKMMHLTKEQIGKIIADNIKFNPNAIVSKDQVIVNYDLTVVIDKLYDEINKKEGGD